MLPTFGARDNNSFAWIITDFAIVIIHQISEFLNHILITPRILKFYRNLNYGNTYP